MFLGGGFVMFALGAAIAAAARSCDRLCALRARSARGHRVPADDALRERLLRLRSRSREHDADELVGRQPRARGRRAAARRRAGRRARARGDRHRADVRSRSRGGPLHGDPRSRSFVLAWELQRAAAAPVRARRSASSTPRSSSPCSCRGSASLCRRPTSRRAKLLALTIVPLALLQFAMLLAIEFPDATGDAATGKRTLVVRLGARARRTALRRDHAARVRVAARSRSCSGCRHRRARDGACRRRSRSGGSRGIADHADTRRVRAADVLRRVPPRRDVGSRAGRVAGAYLIVPPSAVIAVSASVFRHAFVLLLPMPSTPPR